MWRVRGGVRTEVRKLCFYVAFNSSRLPSNTFVTSRLQITSKKSNSLDTLYRRRLELTRTIRGMLDWRNRDENLGPCFFDFFDLFLFSIASNHTWTRFSEMTVGFRTGPKRTLKSTSHICSSSSICLVLIPQSQCSESCRGVNTIKGAAG